MGKTGAEDMSETARIFLIGPMGTGKTTIGNQLARSLGYSFVDADQEIEARTGASIALIFDVEGEQPDHARARHQHRRQGRPGRRRARHRILA